MYINIYTLGVYIYIGVRVLCTLYVVRLLYRMRRCRSQPTFWIVPNGKSVTGDRRAIQIEMSNFPMIEEGTAIVDSRFSIMKSRKCSRVLNGIFTIQRIYLRDRMYSETVAQIIFDTHTSLIFFSFDYSYQMLLFYVCPDTSRGAWKRGDLSRVRLFFLGLRCPESVYCV